MIEKSLTESNVTLGALLRLPYERMSEWLYAELARSGFEDVRPAFSAVLRHLPASGARVIDLAVRAGMSKQSMGYLVDQMSQIGLVDIKPDPHDRRAKTVRLTPRGEQVIATGVALSRQYEAKLATVLGARKMAQLRSILVELYDQVDDAPGKAEL